MLCGHTAAVNRQVLCHHVEDGVNRFILSALFGCDVAGARYFLMDLRISPDAALGVNGSAYLIFIVVIGRIGTIEGPIVGTLVFFLLRELLAAYGTWYMILIGRVAVITMIVCPQRLRGYVARRFDLHFPRPAPRSRGRRLK